MSWKSCRTLIAKLCRRIAESRYDPEVVVGIGMGGIPLSLALRYALGRVQWETLVLKKYHDERPLPQPLPQGEGRRGEPLPQGEGSMEPPPSRGGGGGTGGVVQREQQWGSGEGTGKVAVRSGGGEGGPFAGKLGAEREVRLEIQNCTTLHIEGKRILLVDDVLGAGDTLALAKVVLARRSPTEMRTAVLFANRDRLDQVDYWGMGVSVETQGPWRELMEIMC